MASLVHYGGGRHEHSKRVRHGSSFFNFLGRESDRELHPRGEGDVNQSVVRSCTLLCQIKRITTIQQRVVCISQRKKEAKGQCLQSHPSRSIHYWGWRRYRIVGWTKKECNKGCRRERGCPWLEGGQSTEIFIPFENKTRRWISKSIFSSTYQHRAQIWS